MRYLFLTLALPLVLLGSRETIDLDDRVRFIQREGRQDFSLNSSRIEDEMISTEWSLFSSEPKEFVFPKNFYQYPGYSQQVVLFSDDGLMVELEDGTRLRIRSGDAHTLLTWQTKDQIVIYSNEDWFSSYQLRIGNLSNSTEVRANVTRGPHLNSPILKRVDSIDLESRIVTLSDSSSWKIASKDFSRMKRWMLGDVVLVGCSESSKGSVILFNIPLGDSSRKYIYADPATSLKR